MNKSNPRLPSFLPLPRARAHHVGNSHADAVVVGITVVCVFLLLLITLLMVVCRFFRKNDTIKKGVSMVQSLSWQSYDVIHSVSRDCFMCMNLWLFDLWISVIKKWGSRYILYIVSYIILYYVVEFCDCDDTTPFYTTITVLIKNINKKTKLINYWIYLCYICTYNVEESSGICHNSVY